MNLYLRLLWTLLRSPRLPALQMGQTLERSLRVLPNDIDLNGHMNNGRYLTLLDLMLVEYFVRLGFARVLLRQRWRPMAGGSFITYRRGLKPLQRYTLRFRVEACDSHWIFMRFEFVGGERVCAAGYVKGALVGAQGLVSSQQAQAATGTALPANALPSPVQHWLNAEQGLMASAW
jgi:acyl-CoA thioesterase FadM